MARWAFLLWTFLTYCLVAGLAWFWVLGISFSVWRLMGIALLQVLCTAFQMIFSGALSYKVKGKE